MVKHALAGSDVDRLAEALAEACNVCFCQYAWHGQIP